MPSPTPPPEFFDLVQQGDRRATAEFADRFGPVAHTLLRVKFARMTEAEHEELVQEILLDVIASLPKYDRTRAFKPWFLTIVQRRALDFMERHANEWVEGEYGYLPTHVSYEEATGPEGAEEVKAQIRAATAIDAEPNADSEDAEDTSDASHSGGRLTEQLSAVRQWMASLSPEQQVLLSHYTLGASWEEVAEKLGELGDVVTPATARVRGHRLKAAAKKVVTFADER